MMHTSLWRGIVPFVVLLSFQVDCFAYDMTSGHSVKLHDEIATDPTKGMFLIARRGMPDPRFRQTVILLAAHDKEGSLGLIVNRASNTKLTTLLPDLDDMDKQGHRVYIGGPVGIQQIKFLVRNSNSLDTALHIMDDLYISGNPSTLEEMLTQDMPPTRLRFYLGYAGWGPHQLDGELDRRDWYLRKANMAEIFSDRPESIWQDLIEHYEPKGQLVEIKPRDPIPDSESTVATRAFTPAAEIFKASASR
jgi:putative transcriptional regulator